MKRKPGDLIRAFHKKHYRLTINNKSRYFGTDEDKTRKVVINKKMSKTKNLDGTKKKNKYPGVADTITHELLHVSHPKMHEKTVYKKTRKMVKTMSRKSKQKLYAFAR